jgi:hypothetical protein
MRLELASAALRRERAAAMRRSLKELVERLTPLAQFGRRPARLGQTVRKPDFIQTQRNPS